MKKLGEQNPRVPRVQKGELQMGEGKLYMANYANVAKSKNLECGNSSYGFITIGNLF